MSRARISAGASLCLGLLAACSSDDDPAPAKARLTAVTVNAGLAIGFVEASEARAPKTIEATLALKADVLCVQEFWRDDHVAALVQGATRLPHRVIPEPEPGPTGAIPCQSGDTDALLQCVQANDCHLVCSDKLVTCGLDNCASQLFALPPSCLGCVQANVGNSLDDILSACEAPAIEYAYGGSFGIGLLSAHPIKSQEVKVLDSTTNRRAIAYALLDTPVGEVHAFCTHLTAVFSNLDYPKATGSWEEEQAAQLDELIAWVASKATGDANVLVLGDLNTGPAGSGYEAEVPQNYQKLVSAGFANPYTATSGHQCTYCADNPIVKKGNDDKTSVVIDHVLSRGFSGFTSRTERVLEGTLSVENCDETIVTGYSDHYGVSVTFTAP